MCITQHLSWAELLKDLQKAVGTRGQLNGRSSSGPSTKEAPEKNATLADLGISHKQSSNWQRLASVPQEMVSRAHRAQADALEIEALAKRRVADEYDAAQERGEVGKQGQRTDLLPEEKKVPTPADLGLTHKEIHEARRADDREGADRERRLGGFSLIWVMDHSFAF